VLQYNHQRITERIINLLDRIMNICNDYKDWWKETRMTGNGNRIEIWLNLFGYQYSLEELLTLRNHYCTPNSLEVWSESYLKAIDDYYWMRHRQELMQIWLS
jgi:hypothetical protein